MPTLQAPTAINGSTKLKQPSSRWVVMGDSLVYGFGDPIGGGWVERLRRQWLTPGQDHFVLYNLGVRGDGVRQVELRLEDEFRTRGEIRNRVPDLLLLSCGVNDSPRLGRPDGRNFLAIDAFKIELENLLDQAKKLCPVLFIGTVPVNEAKMPFLDCLYYNHIDQHRYKEITRIACNERGIPYLDLFDLWMGRGDSWWQPLLSEDGLHPNSTGYEAILADVQNWSEIQQRLCCPTGIR
ncbi:G-D-S-L family lipolytic protein [filamentous cyanobacterium LEGE 11480]|uniref:G-D-S-L family lipolytic protein n=1 Tax=Romeriopsis navalis LEGE 11480 TaxID=2777977 RepID=A0A928VUM9_9CYAN|nr:GDSL-type esterase/lipase family protein [Romeriopsis navalis]MBE9032890.1 G-D-S-L family lipolytic protein [Romeriopsis navalis LEGE 11480]